MTIKLQTTKFLNSSIAKVATGKEKLQSLIHTTACETLLHAATHGDVTLCQRLFNACANTTPGQERNNSIRAEALRAWFRTFGPITSKTDEKTGNKVWKLKEGWKASDFKLEAAEATPFWMIAKENPVALTFDKVLNLVANIATRMDDAAKEGRYDGNVEADKKALASIVDFAAIKRLKDVRKNGTVTSPAPQPDKLITKAEQKARKARKAKAA